MLVDETIQGFIDIWENLKVGPRSPRPPPTPLKDDVRGRRIPPSMRNSGRNVSSEEPQAPALYLQLQTSFGGWEGMEENGRKRSSSGHSPTTSLCSSDREGSVILTPYIVSSPDPARSSVMEQFMFPGGASGLSALTASTSTVLEYELSPVNLSPVPEGLYPPSPPPRFAPAAQRARTPPVPVAQGPVLYPVSTSAPHPRLLRSLRPLRLAGIPEYPTMSKTPPSRKPRFENPRARPITPARKPDSTPGSPDRLRPMSSLPIPASSTRGPTPGRSRLSKKAARVLGLDYVYPLALKARASNIFTGSSSHPSGYGYYSTSPVSTSPSSYSSTSSSSYSSTSSYSSIFSPYDPTADCTALTTALNHYTQSRNPSSARPLNRTVAKITLQPAHLPTLHYTFKSQNNSPTSLTSTVHTLTTGPHRLLLLRLLSGPYRSEAEWLSTYCCRHKRRAQVPPDDKLVAELLFGRTPADLRNLKSAFAEMNNGWDLRAALEEVYGPQNPFCVAAVRLLRCDRAEDGKDVDVGCASKGEDVAVHVEDLYSAAKTGGVKYLDQRLLLEVIVRRSDHFLRALCQRFRERHARELVDVVAARERVLVGKSGVWPNNLAYALVHALSCASARATRDAKLLHDTIGLLGVQDTRLIARAVRLHFDQGHLRDVRDAYRAGYGKDLAGRIGGEVKNEAYRDLIVRVLEGGRG